MTNTTTTTFPELQNQYFTRVWASGDKEGLHFLRADGKQFRFYHEQGCCENVEIDDICGDLEHLVDTPILIAEETCNVEGEEGTQLWTFYRFATVKGTVVVKWYGTSNGFYSMSVKFEEVK